MFSVSERCPLWLWLVTLILTNIFIGYVAFGLGKGLNNAELVRTRAERDALQQSLVETLVP